MNRIRALIGKGVSSQRLKREYEDPRNDFVTIRDVYCEMYNYVEEAMFPQMDQWEKELAELVYRLEVELDRHMAVTDTTGGQETT